MPGYLNRYLLQMGPARVARLDPQPALVRRGEYIFRSDQSVRRLLFCDSGLSSTLVPITPMKPGDVSDVEIYAAGGSLAIVGVHTLLRPPESLYTYLVRIDVAGWWIEREAMHQLMAEDQPFSEWMQRIAQLNNRTINRVAACRGGHSDEQRLCSALLALRDTLGTDRIAVTRKVLAQMVPTSDTYWQNTVRRLEGIITRAPRYVEIHDAKGLRALACDCFSLHERREEVLRSLKL